MKSSQRPLCRPRVLHTCSDSTQKHRPNLRVAPVPPLWHAPEGRCPKQSRTAPHRQPLAEPHWSGSRPEGPADPRRREATEATWLTNLEPGLEQLPPKEREVLVMVWLEAMSYEQVAAILGVSVGTVMSRLNRALERLHRWLASAAGPVSWRAD